METKTIPLGLKSYEGEELHFTKTNKMLDLINKINNIELEVDNKILFDTFHEIEALYSSEVEGYFTTRRDLNKFINKEREPKSRDEVAIFGNYMALDYGIINKDRMFTRDYILELNTLITDTPVLEYRLEDVDVVSKSGKIVHHGINYLYVSDYMNSLMDFMKTNNLELLIASCIIHFYFVYVHPFIDGNGRTARALSYLYLINNGEDKFKLFSISYMLPKRRGQYYRELKKVEVNGYDLTEFIEFILETIIIGLEDIKCKHSEILVLEDVERKFMNAGIPFSNMTETILKFIIDKDKFTVDNFYKKNRSKYRRLGLTDTEILEDINIVLNRLINLNIITKDFKLSEEYDNGKM